MRREDHPFTLAHHQVTCFFKFSQSLILCTEANSTSRSWVHNGIPNITYHHKPILYERLKQGALLCYPSLPECWFHYKDDAFAKLHKYKVGGFTKHLNFRESNIQFTMEPKTIGKLAFLHVCEQIKDDGSTKFTIYLKPTLTN